MRSTIAYDLWRPGQNYDLLYWSLEYIGAKRVQGSLWFYDGPLTPEQIRDILKWVMDENDDLVVIEMGHRWAAFNSRAASLWLSARRAVGLLLSRLA